MPNYVIAIGDLHGRNDWEAIVGTEPAAKVVFMGDYFDSFDVPPAAQMENFARVVAFKQANPSKVVLLIGNHDYHYLRGALERYSGYQYNQAFDIQEALHAALPMMQMGFVYGSTIFTHAGITNTWWEKYFDGNPFDVDLLNDVFLYKLDWFGFQQGKDWSKGYELTGNQITHSPIWVRPPALLSDKIDGHKQVVGHTVQKSIRVVNDIALIDVLSTSGEYFLLENRNGYFEYQTKQLVPFV